MRLTRKTQLAICAIALTAPLTAAAATTPLATAALPPAASTTTVRAQVDAMAVDLTAPAGSTNVVADGSRLILGDAAATVGSSRLAQRSGLADLRPVHLSTTTAAVTVTYAAGTPDNSAAEVDVRALVKGRWTEWAPTATGAATSLPAPSKVVQLRIVLTAPAQGAKPWVGDVSLRPSSGISTSAAAVLAAPLTSHVYATREGLVGGTTANGHVIVSRDHFVALPSRRGLSAAGSGTYTVQVCVNGRCAFEPVWDVGPWNTKDDYWNPSATREMWKDLPQGRPEAQAAYQSGYNGGRDQFGRTVANPAGIDLADGVFWDALQLTDNSWVDVTYLWTGTGGRGTVAISSGYLNVRSAASSTAAVVGMAGKAAQVPIQCQVTGQSVTGSQGTTSVWLRLRSGMYVSKAWISTGTHPAC